MIFMRFLGKMAPLLALCLALTVQVGGAAEKIPVIASIVPLGDFCDKIGGERVSVKVLIPPGASPHVFEPTPVAVARAMEARVFVYVGAGLDPWAERLIASRAAGKLIAVRATEGLPLIQEVAHHHGQHKDHQGSGDHKSKYKEEGGEHAKPGRHSHQQGNPHVWLDPVLAKDICRRIAQAFIQADPAHKKEYEANLAAYLGELDKLHADISHEVAAFRVRDYVTFHPAFAYFSRRYGLREVGVIEAAPGREPSPGHLQRLIADIRKFGVNVVFAEPQLSPRVAEVIAREAGVRVLLLDPLGGRPPYGSDYLNLMRHNLAVLTQALK
jgi:zinc transport system substrate-binding protein